MSDDAPKVGGTPPLREGLPCSRGRDAPAPSPAALFVVAVQLLLAVVIVLAGGWTDRANRSAGPEAPFIAYAAALASGDLAGALDQLAADLRPGAEAFVAHQLGNRYIVLESAVRTQSTADRWLQRPASPTTVSTVLEVRNEDGSLWRTTEEMPVTRTDGRWYLAKVPLKPSDQ